MPNDLTEARAALKSTQADQRLAAVQFLGAYSGQEACEVLLTSLGDPDTQVHEAILNALARQTAPDLVARLVTILHEGQAARRNSALSVLIEIGARTPEALTRALQNAAPEIRLHVAEILGDLRNPSSVPPLTERLADGAEFPNVRHAAAQALGKIGDRGAVPALISAADQGDFWVRYAAVEALGRLGDERALQPLLRLMREDAWTRPAIVQALGNLESLEAVEPLVSVLDDANQAVRVASMEALIKIVIEPGEMHSIPVDRLNQIRRLLPAAALIKELTARSTPNSAYAAHLLGWLTEPQALPELISALGATDETLRYAAAEAILRFGHTALATLVDALASPQAHIRESAIELLGMLADPESVPDLLRHLTDESIDVRQAAVRALGSVSGDAAYEGLLQALLDPASSDTALGVLGQLRDANQSGDLRNFLQHHLYVGSPAIRAAAARALSLFGDEGTVSILLNATRLPDPAIRQPAAEALAKVRGNRAVSVLIEALGDRDWLVRQKAVEALSAIPDGRAATALLQLVNDPEWRVRHTLVRALGRLDDVRIFDALELLAEDHDHWIRRGVMELCGGASHARASHILLSGLRDAYAHVRQAALIALGCRRDPATAEAAAEHLTAGDARIRMAAVRALTQIGGPLALERIPLLVRDPDVEVRLAVADALAELGEEGGIEALEVMLEDEATAVREHTAEALAHIGTLSAAEALAAALSSPLARGPAQAWLPSLGDQALRALLGTARSSQAELRAAAAETLGRLQISQAVPTLRYMLRDSDARVRQAAEAALKRIAE